MEEKMKQWVQKCYRIPFSLYWSSRYKTSLEKRGKKKKIKQVLLHENSLKTIALE